MKSYALVLTLMLTQARAEVPVAAVAPRYSDMAACQSVLLDLGRQDRVTRALERIVGLTSDDKDLGGGVRMIAENPNSLTEDHFTVTHVYEGKEAIDAYVRRAEAQAARLEDQAHRQTETQLFNDQTVRRQGPPLASFIGGLTTSVALSVAVPFLLNAYLPMTMADLIEVSAAVGIVGGLTTSYVWGPRGEWAARLLLANRQPKHRRALIERIWAAQPSYFFTHLDKMIATNVSLGATTASPTLSARRYQTHTFPLPRAHVKRWLEMPLDRREASMVQALTERRDWQVPPSVLPLPSSVNSDGSRSIVGIYQIVFIDPETHVVSLIVHARGKLKFAFPPRS